MEAVAQQSSYVWRMPRRLVRYTTTRRALSGGGGGGAFLASFASISFWNKMIRARTTPGNFWISPFLLSSSSAAAAASRGGDSGGSSSTAFLKAARTSGSNAGDPGADFTCRSPPWPSTTTSSSSSSSSSS
ncbi:Os06g0226083 [Oryza sativa Japonica Group]|uniref:Os06g0226083 protein n=1 Tax=Oryza sativa subsp. japonica TaxID=39947 RepID=A0A0N7KLT0_ORYSJ|nr:hypothetical protein EE612_032826 [Oryza sativa]BAS96873.1 Os06g0226083 [Oryza sativa Japonica Group]